MADHPTRPRTDKPDDIGFTKQAMTRWLSPSQLISTGLQVLLSGIFGTYSDKREIQGSRPDDLCTEFAHRPELWFDYVSDLGDGFNPTYALASLLAGEKLDLPGAPGGGTLPTTRGSLLVMGGDEVYPAAEIDAYRNRMTGPYRAALPYTLADHPRLFAIPGNHDWYDGLTSFIRVFCQESWVGGWKTFQRRSYFAIPLPHRWWLWGIDIQFDTYIDAPQLEYFRDTIGPQVNPGDSVILCSAKPNWVTANQEDPDAYNTLDYFQRQTVEKHGAQVRLHLTGDAHHYARYQSVAGGRHLITAGGGGAFLSATHHLTKELLLPPPASRAAKQSEEPPEAFDLKIAYPTKDESRRIARGVVTLPRKNPSYAGLVAGIYVLYAWTIQAAVRRPGQSLADAMHDLSFTGAAAGIARNPLALLFTGLLVVGLAGFTRSPSRRKKWFLGSAHTLLHLAAVVAVVRIVDQLLTDVRGWPYMAGLLVLVGVIGGLVGSLVMAAYLYCADKWFNCNDNELFASQRIEGWKNFLRLHLDGDGVLTVYPVKVADVPKDWRLRQGGEDDDPWFEPLRPLAPELIEAPIRITPAVPPPPAVPPASGARRRRTKP